VKYSEEINDNQEFFGKVQQQYARGDSGGRDLHVVSDWMAAKMIRLGYVQKLDRAVLPNVERNLIDRLRSPTYDSKREFTVPWQSGMTGLIYRKDLVKHEPRSMEDFFDRDYRGKVTLLSEMYDTVPMVLLGQDGDPATATKDELLAAIERVERESRSGQIRRFTGNEYTRNLAKGDSWIALGWSGDAIQLEADKPDIRFTRPEEGFLLWADNMQIPVGAPHAYTAEKLMDFVYRPDVQLAITEWVNYVCPVKGVQELLEKRDPELARSELIFPTEESLKGATDLRALDRDEEREVEAAFQRAIGA
jgi:spermidine/putrescine transport system substrate-binding protein